MAFFDKIKNIGAFLQKTIGKDSSMEKKEDEPIAHSNLNINLSQLNPNTMALFDYGVGGNEVKVDASEAINEIQPNKTLLVSQLTNEAPSQPEKVEGLKTVEEVFRHFKPNIDIEMSNTEGETINENLKFGNLGDFMPKNITEQSPFLNTLSIQQREYTEIMKQLKSNKVLQKVLENAESKEAVIAALKEFAKQIENAD